MYIRKTVRKARNGKEYVNYLLVESFMTDKGPRQRTVCSLGDLKPRPLKEWLALAHRVEEKLAGQLEMDVAEDDPLIADIVEKVRARRKAEEPKEDAGYEIVPMVVDKVAVEECREAGPTHVSNCFWDRLGMDELLAGAGFSDKARLLTRVMTLNRLVCPKSEHAMPGWAGSSAVGDLVGADLSALSDDALYRNLDRLHAHREEIERELAARERELFNLDNTIYLYDLTSTYFEGQCERNPQAKRGYSRDGRPDCKQVVVGLVVNRDGFPVAHEVFEGNTRDSSTVDEMLDTLENRVGKNESATVVVDRGMAFDANLESIKARGYHYIVATRQSERNDWLEEFETGGWQEVVRETSETNPAQKKSSVWVKQAEGNKETYVLCISEGRSKKDEAIRAAHEKRLLADVERLKKRIVSGKLKASDKIWEAIGRIKERYPRVARYYSIAWDGAALRLEENAEKKAIAQTLDGGYLLKTDRADLSADEAWRVYCLLTRAESAFRAMKSPLAERPIFHQTENRVQAHIFLCILAYHLLIAIEKTLRDKGIHDSFETVRDVLSSHQVVTVVLPTVGKGVLRIRKGSTPEPEHVRIYDALGVPHTVMIPVRTWSNA
ncbi:MAG: IS1634 family transposase [Bacteroidota bacterium]